MGVFEKIIEHIVNQDEQAAKALFHKVVVNTSRKIYEDLEQEGPEDFIDEVSAEETAGDDEHGMVDGEEEIGGDQADDLVDDTIHDEDEFSPENEEFGVGDEFEEEGDLEDRVVNIEDSLDELKAEFEKIMSDTAEEHEEEEEEVEDDLEDADEEVEDVEEHEEEEEAEGEPGEEEDVEGLEDADEDIEDAEEENEEEEDEDEELVREYVEKVAVQYGKEKTETAGTNTKSLKFEKNPLGSAANPKNLVQGGEESGRPAPKAKDLIGKVGNTGGQGKGQQLKPGPKPTKDEEGNTNKKSVL